MSKFNLQEVRTFIKNSDPQSKIYIGADSERFKKGESWWATYCVAVVVHYAGNKGCKVFGDVVTEIDYDQRKDKPFNRMMNEVYKAADMFLKIEEAIEDRHCEVHLDINSDEMHGSSCALSAAIGYIRGTCHLTPKVKPDAPVASICADRLQDLIVW